MKDTTISLPIGLVKIEYGENYDIPEPIAQFWWQNIRTIGFHQNNKKNITTSTANFCVAIWRIKKLKK